MKSDLESKGEAVIPWGAGPPRPRTLRGYLMLGLAFVTCPCHLPILAVLLAGTGAATYFKQNLWTIGGAVTAVFATSLVLGLRWIRSENQSPGR